jgi:hypothetical protein
VRGGEPTSVESFGEFQNWTAFALTKPSILPGRGIAGLDLSRLFMRERLQRMMARGIEAMSDHGIVPLICPTCQNVFLASFKASTSRLLCMGLFSIFLVGGGLEAGLAKP